MKLLVVLGAPGAGKGTQAKRLSATLSLPHISSGDLFRDHMVRGTELGREAEQYISRGELVPDDVTIGMLRQRLGEPDVSQGAILDGFPRTVVQAEALEQIAQELDGRVQATIYVQVPEQRLIERLSGRRVCRQAGHVYHLEHNPPKRARICDLDGSELYQRSDDQPETVRNRVRVYQTQTEPLIDYYRRRGVLVEVDGDQPIEQVTDDVIESLDVGVSE